MQKIEKKKWEYNGDIFLLLDKNSFATSRSRTFSWKPKIYNYFKDKLQLHRRCSVKKVFFNISQNSQENLCWSLFNSGDFFKKWIQHCYFLVNFAEFLRIPILQNIWERLLLTVGLFLEVLLKFQKVFKSTNEEMLLIYIVHTAIRKGSSRK